MLLYVVVGAVAALIAFSLGYLVYRKSLARKIMQTGIKVKGIMIECREKPARSGDKLAGRIYLPTITFFTTDGQPMVGTPILGLKSFTEIIAPMEVQVIYDQKDPQKFCMSFLPSQ